MTCRTAIKFINSIQYSEKNKLLFVGTDSKGIIIISKKQVKPSKKIETLSSERNAYYSQVELSDGNILTNEGHVIIASNEKKAIDLPIKSKFNFTVYKQGDSVLWFSQPSLQTSVNCLHSYDYRTRTTTSFNKIIINESFGLLEVNNKIYVTTNIGIANLSGDTLNYLYKYPQNNNQGTAPSDIKELSPGVIVIAACNGLTRFNINTSKLDTIYTSKGYCVRSLWLYKDYLFFGTYGKGYFIYKNGVVKAMPLDKNNFLLYTHCFVADELGYCWMSTNRGLLKARISDLISAYNNSVNEVYYHYLGKNDGMDISEMNGGCAPCALILKNKNISFPTMDGLLLVDPNKINTVIPDGEIFIDDFIINNKESLKDTVLLDELPASTKDISICLGYAGWCNKENIYLAYKLNNQDDWQQVDSKNESDINFSNITSGDYNLQIRKMNGFGINNFSYKTISFSILAPWYKAWWFYLLIAVTVFGLFVIFYKIRTKNLKKRQVKLENQVAEKTEELLQKNDILEKSNNINTRLISIISHDIITPLKFLNVAGKNLIEKKSLMSEELKDETIQEITSTSKELQLLSTNILNWIKYQNKNRRLIKEEFNVHELVNQIFGVLQSLAKQKNIQLINLIDKEEMLFQYFEPLKILIYNLITNAINFTSKGTINVSNNFNGPVFIIQVKDEGAGMTREQIENIMADQFIVSSANLDNKKGNGLGYLIIKDLLKMMDATILINSERNRGTTVSIKIPTE